MANGQKATIDLSGWISMRQFLDLKIEEVEMLWEPFLPRVGMAGLAGMSDCGKSSFMRALSMAVASGKAEFLGYPLKTVHQRTLYVVTEDTADGIAAWSSKHKGENEVGKNCDRLLFRLNRTGIPLELDKALTQNPADLVVIDAWSDTFLGNPNNFNEVRKNFGDYSIIAQKHNCLILIIHHLNKSAQGFGPDKIKINGSQAIEAVTRSFLELRNEGKVHQKKLTILKGNYTSDEIKNQSVILEFDPKTFSFSNLGLDKVKSKGGSKKYDAIWAQRMNQVREQTGESYTKCYFMLKSRFPDEAMPSRTWFIDNCRDSEQEHEIDSIEIDL